MKLVTSQAGGGGKAILTSQAAGGAQSNLLGLSSVQPQQVRTVQSTAGRSTIIKTIPTSMLNVARPAGATVQSATSAGPGGKQTIVIAAPKSRVGGVGQPTKFVTTVPKLSTATSGATNTQFIVVTTRPGGQTSSVQAVPAGTTAGTRQIIQGAGGKQIITIVTSASALQGALSATGQVASAGQAAKVISAPVVVSSGASDGGATVVGTADASGEVSLDASTLEQLQLQMAAGEAEQPMQVDGTPAYILPQVSSCLTPQ